MITAAGNMKPLPVRPVDGIRALETSAPLPQARTTRYAMQPLPMPQPDCLDLAEAVRSAAFARMLERSSVKHPLPVVDPTA